MLASLLLCPILLLVAPAAAPAPADGLPLAVHVGSYESPLGARVTRDGFIDLGSMVARFVDLDTGEPIAFRHPKFAQGPGLTYTWDHESEAWRVEAELVAVPLSAAGDERLALGVRLLLQNHGFEPITARLGMELFPAPQTPTMRPVPTHVFAPGQVWEQGERSITRDGQLMAQWTGLAPSVELTSPASASDRAANLSWSAGVPPGSQRYVEVMLFGEPSTGKVDHERFGRGVAMRSFRDLDDQQRWQGEALGAFSTMVTADVRYRNAWVAAVAQIRTLGTAYQGVNGLSDQPYGRPASDVAVSAQMLGVLYEVGMKDISWVYFQELLADTPHHLSTLEPQRQLMFLHGLARVARLLMNEELSRTLGAHIREFLASGAAEGLTVDPWLHPENVRLDLKVVLDHSAQGGAELLPEFALAPVTPDSLEARLQQLALAIKQRDSGTAWEVCDGLMARTTRWGFGSLRPDGEADGLWGLAMGTLLREMLIDDHSDELHLMSGADMGLITPEMGIETELMPTRFGMLKVEQYHSGKGLLGGWVQFGPVFWPERILMHFSAKEVIRGMKGTADGGSATLLEDNVVELVIVPGTANGLRFAMKVKPHQVDGALIKKAPERKGVRGG